MTISKHPTAIIFDWDNTLVDSFPLIIRAHNHTRKKYGLDEFTIETASKYSHRSARSIYPEWFGKDSDDAITHLYDFITQFHLDELNPLPDSENCLKFLAHHNITCAVVSNKRGDLLRKEIEHLRWGQYFKTIVGAGDAAKDKPDPDPAIMALNTLDLSPSKDIWYLGDSESDFKVSHTLALTSIYIKNRPLMDQETLNKYSFYKQFLDIAAFLKDIEGAF